MLTPLNGFILVEPVEKAKETASGLVIDVEKNAPIHGVGIVKKFNKSDTPAFTVGDRVLYLLAEATQVQLENEMYVLVPMKAIQAVLED